MFAEVVQDLFDSCYISIMMRACECVCVCVHVYSIALTTACSTISFLPVSHTVSARPLD